MQLHLAAKKLLRPDITTFYWDAPQPVVWRAGQYGVFYLEHQSDQNGPERFFTIDNPPYFKQLSFTTRISNTSFKQTLNSMPIEGVIELRSVGGGFIIQDLKQRYIFVAFGIGITPFRSILLDSAHKHLPLKVELFYQHANDEFLFEDDFKQLQKTLSLTLNHFSKTQQLINQVVKQSQQLADAHFYIAGPIPLVEKTEDLLLQNGIPHYNIYGDYFEYDWSQLTSE